MKGMSSALLFGVVVCFCSACDSAPVAEPEYEPPVANAGSNQTLWDRDGNGFEPVVLDASASIRGSRQIVRYQWEKDDSPVMGATFDSGRTLHVDVDVGRHWFVLTVTDDSGRSDRDTTVIEIRPPNPIVGIILPGNGTTHATGRDLVFRGRGVDQYDSLLTGSRLVWASDLDGEIGTGEEFVRADLSRGEHVITLNVTDRSGFVGSSSVGITLIDPPTATILEPEDGRTFFWAEDVNLAGTCERPGDEPSGDVEALWYVSGEGLVGSGLHVRPELSPPGPEFISPGPHMVTLVCADERGVNGEASATIDIEVSFAVNIQPMFELLGCLRCHGGADPAGGIGLDSYEAITGGGNASGPLIVPGDAMQGTLIGELVLGHEQIDPDDFPYRWWGWDPRDFYVNFDSWWATNILARWIDAGALEDTPADPGTNTPPTASITDPCDGFRSYEGRGMYFGGKGMDAEDGLLSNERFAWTYDGKPLPDCNEPWNGLFSACGNGGWIESIELGPHVLTLTVTDSEGATGSASITMTGIEFLNASFADDILSFMLMYCANCHGAEWAAAEIRLDSYEAITTGANSNGPLIVEGDPAEGILIPKVLSDHLVVDGYGIHMSQWMGETILPVWILEGARNTDHPHPPHPEPRCGAGE